VSPDDHTTSEAAAPRRGRGRPATITRDQIVRAATRIGLDDLTVQAVADELGVTRAAIYHYVDGADDLLRLTALETLTPFDDLEKADDVHWDGWLRAFADACRTWRLEQADVLRKVSFDITELNWFLGILDRGIEVLVDAGFSESRAGHALHFISGLVWINTQDELLARDAPDGRHPQAVVMEQTVDRSDLALRHIHHGVDRAAFMDPDARFEREISWAIDALRLQLDRDRSGET
jgi:AcrR family transcriptional regulator